MLRSLNVATPDTALMLNVPDRVAPDGFVPIAIVTMPEKPVAGFPPPSSAVTCTAGVMIPPAPALLGWTVNWRLVAVPASTLKALLGVVRLPDVAASR